MLYMQVCVHICKVGCRYCFVWLQLYVFANEVGVKGGDNTTHMSPLSFFKTALSTYARTSSRTLTLSRTHSHTHKDTYTHPLTTYSWKRREQVETIMMSSAQEWRNRILVGNEPLMCSKICFTKNGMSPIIITYTSMFESFSYLD